MKRLNFSQVIAEKSSMQKVDPFFIMILFIFSLLTSAFFAFDFHLSGIDLEKQKAVILENKVRELKVANEALQLQIIDTASFGTRKTASIAPRKEISFDDVYKSQLQFAVNNKKVDEIISLSQKILNTSADQSLLAEALFQKTVVSCKIKQKEAICFNDIEALVNQFPESKLAGESLVMLIEIYNKLKRFKEAESVIKIVRTEFPKERELIQRLTQLEKNRL